MADEPNATQPDQDVPLKPVGKAGKVIAPTATQSGAGVAWNNGAATYAGSDGKDMFNGSEKDDIFLSNGSTKNADLSDPGRDRETMNGHAGHDVAVLPGFREDYKAVMPHATQYPGASSPAWENTDTLYGRVIALENIHTGESYVMSNVESVVFDKGDPFANPKQAVQNLPEKIASGAMQSASTQELHLQAQADLSPAEQRTAKIAATRECAQEVAGQYKLGMGVEGMIDMADQVVQKLDQSGIEVDSRKPPEADQPTSNVTQRAFAMDIKPM